MDDLTLMPDTEPFYLCGGEIGCLLVHGLTGSPASMRWLGQYLNGQGHTVYCPRLAGHGTTPTDLVGIRWQEWYYDVLAAYHLLRAQCRRVFVLGLSMGGALTLLFASRQPVDGFVTYSAPACIDNPLLPFLPLIRPFKKTLRKRHLPPPGQDFFQQYVKAEQRRLGEPETGEPGYDVWITTAVIEISRMLEQMREGLPSIRAPGLMFHSRIDRTVPFDHLAMNFERVGSPDKQMVVLERSEHVITRHLERDLVFEKTTQFITVHS